MNLVKAGLLALSALLAAASGAFAQAKPPQKVTLLLNFYLYSEHAPFFLGRERGFFTQEGIDLEIQEGRAAVATVQSIAAGTAQFGYADFAAIVRAADKGAPVMAVGVLLQKNPMAIIGLAEKNIRTPQDMKGKTLALTPGDSVSQVLPLVLKKAGMKEGDFNIVSGDGKTKLNAVITGQADVMLGYLMDQGLRIEDATGKPAHVIPFSDHGANLVSSSIVVAKNTVASDPDLVRRFMRAATRSVEAAEKDPEAAVDAMLKDNPKAGTRDNLVKGLKLTIPLYHTDETKNDPPFRAKMSAVTESLATLIEYGGVDKSAANRVGEFVNLDHLPK